MNKKLLAVAVAGALAAPGVALAQASAVTISGFFKVGVESTSYSNSPATRINTSQMRVVDNSSQIIFRSVEDLGNGLSAVAQMDQRFAPNNAGGLQTSSPIGAGNTYVGLKSNTMGQLIFGRHDLHYAKGGHDIAAKAGALEASGISLFDYINGTAIANASRTPNVVKYDMPNFSGFDATIAWSANPLNGTGDMVNATAATTGAAQNAAAGVIPGTTVLGAAGATAPVNSRKGEGWNINPRYSNGPFDIQYSYWAAKQDAPAASTLDQRGDLVSGNFKFGDFKIGLGVNRSKLTNANTGIKTAERTTWTLPMSYTWGPNNIVGHYTKAGNLSCDTGGGCATSSSGARMIAVAYVYDLSKRTSLGLTYAKINNDSNASYSMFTSASLGTTDATTVAGESPRLLQATIKHAF